MSDKADSEDFTEYNLCMSEAFEKLQDCRESSADQYQLMSRNIKGANDLKKGAGQALDDEAFITFNPHENQSKSNPNSAE